MKQGWRIWIDCLSKITNTNDKQNIARRKRHMDLKGCIFMFLTNFWVHIIFLSNLRNFIFRLKTDAPFRHWSGDSSDNVCCKHRLYCKVGKVWCTKVFEQLSFQPSHQLIPWTCFFFFIIFFSLLLITPLHILLCTYDT